MYVVKGILILDNDGNRLLAKVCIGCFMVSWMFL